MAKSRHLLLVGLSVSILIAVPLSAAAATNNCSQVEIRIGTCEVSGEIKGDGVDVTGTIEGGTGGTGGSGSPDEPEPENPFAIPPRDTFTVTAPLTLADIAHFRPHPGVDNMQPDGWMIVGLDTNFYVHVGRQVHDGQLLGQPASVRFTPIAYHWRYGDGTSATRSTKGGTWQALGIAEFDPTPTSHIYRAAGTYYIDLDISFTAEYRYADSPWIPIAGALRVPANQLAATAGGAKTVLVQDECTANPSGPGC